MITDKNTIYELYKMLYNVHNMLLCNNVPYIASGGTLIGAVRHKGIIPWDNDIDVAIYEKDVPIVLSKNFRSDMLKLGYKVENKIKSVGWIRIFLVENKEIGCDLFILKYMKKDGKNILTHNSSKVRNLWPKDYYDVKDTFPLREYKFGSLVILGPNKYKSYLDRSYGKSWSKVGYITQEPDTHYDLDEPIRLKVTSFLPANKLYKAPASKKQSIPRKGSNILCKWNC